MHRDSIQPGIASDISSISPKGGSIGSNNLERLIGTTRGDVSEIWSLLNSLLKRVKTLEEDAGYTRKVLTEKADYLQGNGILKTTEEGGFALKILNDSVTSLFKGALVRTSTTNDYGVIIAPEGSYDICGIIYDEVIAPDENGYMVFAGNADVWFNENGATKQHYFRMSKASDTGNTDTGKAQSDAITRIDNIRILGNVWETRAGEGLARCKLCINL